MYIHLINLCIILAKIKARPLRRYFPSNAFIYILDHLNSAPCGSKYIRSTTRARGTLNFDPKVRTFTRNPIKKKNPIAASSTAAIAAVEKSTAKSTYIVIGRHADTSSCASRHLSKHRLMELPRASRQ